MSYGQMGRKGRQAREEAIKRAITKELGSDDWREQEPDLYYGVDELLADDETLTHLAEACESLAYAERAAGSADRTEGTREIESAELGAVDAIEAYAREQVSDVLPDAAAYLNDDMTLVELAGDQHE